MKNQHGGVKKRFDYDLRKSDYELFIEMMNSDGATFQILTDKCKNGIIFVLDVHEAASRYLTLGPTGIFNRPVTSFVVKFVITSEEGDEPVGSKYTMKDETFLVEARVQQDIFIDSIVGKRQPLCPGISGFFLFDNANAIAFLTKLLLVPNVDIPEKEMIGKLLKKITASAEDDEVGPLGIGCIEMENIVGSQTLDEFIVGCNFDSLTQYQINIFATLIAQLIRLYLISKKVHLDLHGGNILINGDNVYIIDFGLLWETTQVGNVTNPTREGSFNTEDDREHFLEIIPLLSSQLSAKTPLTNDEKENIAKGIMVAFENLDKFHLKQEYPFHFDSHGQKGQMTYWFNRIKSNPTILVAAFDKFNKMHAVEDLKLSRATLNGYITENKLIDLSLKPQNYYVDVEAAERAQAQQTAQAVRGQQREDRESEDVSSREEPGFSPGFSPGLGGKRKSKKHKKSKKTKKLKKSRKTRKIRNKSKNKN